MKFTLSWLKDYLDTDADTDTIAQKLTDIGLEVEGIEKPGAKFAPFKTAKVISAERHPDADRLQVLRVDTGAGEPVQVVCGAPNARAGMTGIFAPEGSYIPGLDVVLKKGNIRGVDSCGMMVSEREMQLSDEHKGIIEVDNALPIGVPMADIFGLNDDVIEINLTPNRADCAGITGIARDLAGSGLGTYTPKAFKDMAGSAPSPVTVTIDDASGCKQFLGYYITGVKNGASPDWLQAKLKAVGLRPISTLVDITNYMTIAENRPLHVYDADKLAGNIHVRPAKAGESFPALNDKSYTLAEGMTAITDDSGVIGLGGIVGGTTTGVDENTTNVFLECAFFDAYDIALTGRALQVHSDARYRFERGVDPAGLLAGINNGAQMIVDLCGGSVSALVQAGTQAPWQREYHFNPARTTQLGGVDIDATTQTQILTTLGFTVNGDKVTPPSWRPDIQGSADLVEEILRIYGYANIPPVSMQKGADSHSALTPDLKRRQDIRRLLAGRGLKEAVTWSFMQSDKARLFDGDMGDDVRASLTLTNAISSALDRMRPSILPNLLMCAQGNADRGFPNSTLFEIGPVFFGANPAEQGFVAAGVRHLNNNTKHWTGGAQAVSAYDVKADALAILEYAGLNPDKVQVSSTDAPSYYHPGRSAALRLGPNVVGYFGELHPRALEALDVKGPAVGFEVFLDRLPLPKKAAGSARPLLSPSPFQPISRDFAFLADTSVPADTFIKAATAADKNLITGVDIFDVYAGKNMEAGKKSVAITVTLQPQTATLTDKDIETTSQKIIDAIIQKTGATLRG